MCTLPHSHRVMPPPIRHASPSNGAALEFERAVAAHDAQVARDGLSIWIGAEPTFTDRRSEAREWLSEALGSDKEQRAQRLLVSLRARFPGAVVLRTIGRQYAGEARPRWSYGLYARRDGEPVWTGPEDRLVPVASALAPEPALLARVRLALVERLCARGWLAIPVDGKDASARIVFRCDGRAPEVDTAADPRLSRPSLHSLPIPAAGLADDLAATGSYLLVLRRDDPRAPQVRQLSVELPSFSSVSEFLQFLNVLAECCNEARVESLALCGFPPPVDRSILHYTLTPDPAVLEVNQAPSADLATFLRWNRDLYALSAEIALAPERLHYTGTISDSGGGGQLTIGGPTPEESPFFVVPQLLPRLVRYLLRHPALSYWFATRYIGGGSQSPRPDEGLPEQLDELGIGLEQLGRLAAPTPTLLWETLRHFLTDYSGNPHRSELNIEKLHNLHLPGRGCLGLVEFRALRMPQTPERLTAIAMLLRALISVLCRHDLVTTPTRWGDALHDRFALPSVLRRDLKEVFVDLQAAGYGLGARIEGLLLDADERRIGCVDHAGCRLDVEEACEFWPLVGDVVSQESVGSRTVDASTSRIEVRLSSVEGAPLDDWQVLANGYRLPLVGSSSAGDASRSLGVRFRTFVPRVGLHPTVPALSRIDLTLMHRTHPTAVRASLFTWRPDGSAYPGLPEDKADALRRRAERFVVEPLAAAQLPAPKEPRPAALSPFCLDLRRVG
jgi:uncharacterized protein (DUF2126 family)